MKKNIPELVHFLAKWHYTIKGKTKIHQEKANFVPISNTDCEQSAEAINVKPTPGTAPGAQLLREVSYFFVSQSVGPPTLTNQRVSARYFLLAPMTYIQVLR